MKIVFVDGSKELFEAAKISQLCRITCMLVVVYHSILNVACDLVQEATLVLVDFDEDGVMISRHATRVDQIDVVRHVASIESVAGIAIEVSLD